MSITIEDIAALAVATSKRTRIADPAVRALVSATVDMRKRAALADAERAADSILDYTPEQLASTSLLKDVYWPRARAVRAAMRASDADARIAFRDHDTDAVYTHVLRAHRLSVLAALIGRVSARVGNFPISRRDMDATKSAFLRSASWRHFTFNGGRDVGSKHIEPAEIVQGAFIRAIDAGHTVNGVPAYGTMFGHIQSERAHLTRVANAEYVGMRDAAFGNVSHAVEAWPEMTDTHSVRLLGTRNYASISQHRESLAIAHVDAERALIDDAVTHDARVAALDSYDESTEFHAIVARVIMSGATLEELSSALGLTVQTIRDDVIASKLASLRIIDSGIDHSQRSADIMRADEREREIDDAQAEHAARLVGVRVAVETVAYAHRDIVTEVTEPNDDYMARGARVIESMSRDAAREGIESVWHEGIQERQMFTPAGWEYQPDIIRVHSMYLTENVA